MFVTTSHVCDGAFPRHFNSTISGTDRLRIAYTKYTNSAASAIPDDFVVFNIVFAHGNGMNKGVWKYYVDKLINHANTEGASCKWAINSIVAYDLAVQGDSAILNRGKMGWVFQWDDAGRDMNAVVKHEQATSGDFVPTYRHRNLIVAHSMGGCGALFAAFFESQLYDSLIVIDPPVFSNSANKKYIRQLVSLIDKGYQDEFETRQKAENYLRKGFYKRFHEQILQDTINDELYEEGGIIKTKATKGRQISVYLGGGESIKLLMLIAPFISTPVVHVGVSKSNFNPPETTTFIRNAIPKHLLTAVDLQGSHLITGENPEVMLQVIYIHLFDRADIAHHNRAIYPELTFGGDRTKIFEANWAPYALGDGYRNGKKPKL